MRPTGEKYAILFHQCTHTIPRVETLSGMTRRSHRDAIDVWRMPSDSVLSCDVFNLAFSTKTMPRGDRQEKQVRFVCYNFLCFNKQGRLQRKLRISSKLVFRQKHCRRTEKIIHFLAIISTVFPAHPTVGIALFACIRLSFSSEYICLYPVDRTMIFLVYVF